MIALALALALTAQAQEPNPCDGPPSEACEAILTQASMYWEKRYHEERSDHLNTLALCVQAQPQQQEQPQVKPGNSITTILYVALGVVGVGAIGTLIGAYAF